MDYEKKYKEALELARDYYKANLKLNNADENLLLEDIFPELKESEDEKIREMLIDSFTRADMGGEIYGKGVTYKQVIAWLEKQGESYTKNDVDDAYLKGICNTKHELEKQGKVDTVSYEVAEKEKYDFVSGHFIKCRKSFDVFKEDNSYWFEYVGNDNYIGRSDNILNQKFHITPRQLYCLFTQEHCPKEDNANAPTEYGKYVDECLNDASEHFFSEGEDKYSVADLFYAGVRCGKSWFEKQGTSAKLSEEEQNSFAKGVLSSCALSFINYLDAHSYEGKMCVSNGECEDIENAFHNAMWDRLHRYYCKYIEKQDEQKPILDFKASNWYVSKVDGKIHDLTYNPTNKIEPKFKVGDFIVNDYCMGRVIEITNDAYLLDTEQGIPFSCSNTRLWDVTKDAKDGDVFLLFLALSL